LLRVVSHLGLPDAALVDGLDVLDATLDGYRLAGMPLRIGVRVHAVCLAESAVAIVAQGLCRLSSLPCHLLLP